MKIEGTPKEIADFVLAIQNRPDGTNINKTVELETFQVEKAKTRSSIEGININFDEANRDTRSVETDKN
ncbi:hypothetical protein LJB89_03580 [Tyzzerella sp. OttesenSCG-928-J15]|nr:hypothetical protein [Tyzzerella sp. OttesenSCG-928-J15]